MLSSYRTTLDRLRTRADLLHLQIERFLWRYDLDGVFGLGFVVGAALGVALLVTLWGRQ